MYFGKNIVSINLEIPFFERNKTGLYSVNVKPVIWKNNAYLFNTSYDYALINTNRTILYSREEYSKNCFQIMNAIYCKTFKQNKNECFNLITHNRFQKKCFIKLKNKNMITRIEKELYFTVFTPFDVLITENNSTSKLHINQTSKITDTKKYNISWSEMNKFRMTYENNSEKSTTETQHKFLIIVLFTLICILSRLIYYCFYKE